MKSKAHVFYSFVVHNGDLLPLEDITFIQPRGQIRQYRRFRPVHFGPAGRVLGPSGKDTSN